MGAHSYVHFIDTPIYIFIMQRFIFVEKKNLQNIVHVYTWTFLDCKIF